MCILQAEKKCEQHRDELFCGTIKSFNVRRGFGFVACEATAQRFGRDVYLSKDEALLLAEEPAVGCASVSVANGEAATPAKNQGKVPPPVQEGDYLLFQVRLSPEGFPQAVEARKIRRLQGFVSQIPSQDADGIITVSGDGSECAKSADVAVQDLLGAEVRLRHEACGQLQLMTNDEVAFCCVNMEDESDECLLEAQLLELLHTSRANGSVLGCFSLTLPLLDCDNGTVTGSRNVELHGHALTDRIILSHVPLDVSAPDLMRVFSKLGGTDATLTLADGCDAYCCAHITFNTAESVAKALIQSTHTVSENGTTELAYVGPYISRNHSVSSCVGAPDGLAASEVGYASSTSAEASMDALGGHCENASRQDVQPVTLSICNPCVVAAEVTTPTPDQGQRVDWRCIHANIIVPAAAPEIEVLAGHGFSVCVRWPTVVHASAYVVELLDQASMTVQQYTRVAPDGPLPVLMDLRVDGLRPSSYAARLRCIAPCACESACSPWSALLSARPAQFSEVPLVEAAQDVSPLPMAPTALTFIPHVFSQACPPPPSAPPSISAGSAPTRVLPPVPEGAADDLASLPAPVDMSAHAALVPQSLPPQCTPSVSTGSCFVSVVAPVAPLRSVGMNADVMGPVTPPLHVATSNADKANYFPHSCPTPLSAALALSAVPAAFPLALSPIMEEKVTSHGDLYDEILTLD